METPSRASDPEIDPAFAAIDLQLQEFNYYYSEWNAVPGNLTGWLDKSQGRLRGTWDALSVGGATRLLVRLLSSRSRYSPVALRHVCLALAEGRHGGRLFELPPEVLTEVLGAVSDGSAFKLSPATAEAWLRSGNERLVALAISQFASNQALFESIPTVEALLEAGFAGERLPEIYPIGPLLDRSEALGRIPAYRRFVARVAGSGDPDSREKALTLQMSWMDDSELAELARSGTSLPPDADADGAQRAAVIGGLVRRGLVEDAGKMLLGIVRGGDVELARRVIRNLGVSTPEPALLRVMDPLLTAPSPVLPEVVGLLRRRGLKSGLPRLREVAAELDRMSRRFTGSAGRKLAKELLLMGFSLSLLGVIGMLFFPVQVVLVAALLLLGPAYATTEDCLGRAAPRGWGAVERTVRELSGDPRARVYSHRWWERLLRLRQWRSS